MNQINNYATGLAKCVTRGDSNHDYAKDTYFHLWLDDVSLQ